MTGDSGDSERRRFSSVVAPSMRDVLRQPLPPKSVSLWLEEGLRNPQDERIFLLCCMYFLQMRAVRRMSDDSVVEATTWTKTTSRVSSDLCTRKSRVSIEHTKIISVQAQPSTIVAYNTHNVKLPEGQQFRERLTREECETPNLQRKVLKARGRSRQRKKVNMIHVQCEANLGRPPEYDHIENVEDDSELSECYQAMSGKKTHSGKLARLRRSLVKIFKKDSDKLSRSFSNKKIDDLLSVRNCKVRVGDHSELNHSMVSKRQYSNVLNVEPRLSLNYLDWLDERGRRKVPHESDVLYKNEKFYNYNMSDLNVVRSKAVVSLLQQQQQQQKQEGQDNDDDDMESDIREALAAFEDAYLSDPGPTPSNCAVKAATQARGAKSRDVWKPLATRATVGPYSRFREIPSPPSLDWQPPPDFHTILMK